MSLDAEEAFHRNAEEAYTKAQTGDFSASERSLAILAEEARPLATVWTAALRAQRWHAEPSAGLLPDADELARFVGAGPRERVAIMCACVEAVRACVLARDGARIQPWASLLGKLTEADPDHLQARAWRCVADAWFSLSQEDMDAADAHAQQASKLATDASMAAALIEATVLRAFCFELQGSLDEATAFSRRAVRMARVEDLPQWQYLSGIALARTRRLCGLPHLTARILRPLAEVAPPQWSGWVVWEACMAGVLPLAAEVKLDELGDPRAETRALRDVLTAAVGADLASFRSACEALSGSTFAWHSRSADAELVLAVVDHTRPATAALGDWLRGETDTPPSAIKGLCIDVVFDSAESGPAAFVVAGPPTGPRSGRRIAGIGELVAQVDERVARVRGKAERTLVTLSALALAGEQGLSREALFQTVYGFPYRHEVNRGLFNTLIHRVRKAIQDVGSLERRDDERYVLELNKTVLVPDPRCEHSLEDLMLRALARLGSQTAADAAQSAGVPLRTAQRALAHLVDGGALLVEQDADDARRMRYRVEDTTFSEPTKWR